MRSANGHSSRFTAPTAPSRRRSEDGELAIVHLSEQLREPLRDRVDLVRGETHLHPAAGHAYALRGVDGWGDRDRLQDAVGVRLELRQGAESGQLVRTDAA